MPHADQPLLRIASVQLVCSAATFQDLPETPFPEIAVSGRSNVGKSSLLNQLLGRKNLARVSRTPGKTQLLHFFRVNDRFHLVDLPGYGYAKVPAAVLQRWRRTMQGYLQKRRQLVGVMQLVDCRHEPSREDQDMIAWLLEQRLPFCLVPTKMDKLKRGERQAAMARLLRSLQLPPDLPLVPTSSQSGEGRKELLGWLGHALASAPPLPQGTRRGSQGEAAEPPESL